MQRSLGLGGCIYYLENNQFSHTMGAMAADNERTRAKGGGVNALGHKPFIRLLYKIRSEHPKKIIIATLLASCVVSVAQTNKDKDYSGYVTNASLLTPFTFTNASGIVVSNAILVKLTPTKFIYKSPTGGMGMQRLDSLPKELRDRFGYDLKAAQLADEADRRNIELSKQRDEQQREIAVAQVSQNLIRNQVEANKKVFGTTGDCLRVDQITKDGVLASYNVKGVDGTSYSLPFFVKDCPNKAALIDGSKVDGPFYGIGTYTYASVLGASKTIRCLTCSQKAAFQYYSTQVSADADRQDKARKEKLEQERKEAAVPQALRNTVFQKVQAHQTNFVGGFLTVRQITKDGIISSFDHESDEPGHSYSVAYFVKNCPHQDILYEGALISGPFYEIGGFTYTSVLGAGKTLQCLTCSPDAAFQYYLNH
jgi:hypothetical protein